MTAGKLTGTLQTILSILKLGREMWRLQIKRIIQSPPDVTMVISMLVKSSVSIISSSTFQKQEFLILKFFSIMSS